jgi:DNA-3-methyladenine glycosylase
VLTEPNAALSQLAAPLPASFYARPADVVAPELLGQLLVVRRDGQLRAGRIVETEAYVGEADRACHAWRGPTPRASTLYGPPGTAYVYLIYGVHDLFNAVCQPAGVPHAVLVRAVELLAAPADSRGDGPGRLTRALGISRPDNGALLTAPPITIHAGAPVTDATVTARVGVAYAGHWADAPLRFLDAGSPFVSRPSPSTIGRGRD